MVHNTPSQPLSEALKRAVKDYVDDILASKSQTKITCPVHGVVTPEEVMVAARAAGYKGLVLHEVVDSYFP